MKSPLSSLLSSIIIAVSLLQGQVVGCFDFVAAFVEIETFPVAAFAADHC